MSSEVITAMESGRGAFHLKILAHGVLMEADEPVEAGGLGLGLRPTELLCAALAACTTMTLRMYCTRKLARRDGSGHSRLSPEPS
jgi:putative redox protein